eukprot:5654467-Amphidinium_carterae.1
MESGPQFDDLCVSYRGLPVKWVEVDSGSERSAAAADPKIQRKRAMARQTLSLRFHAGMRWRTTGFREEDSAYQYRSK